MGFRELEKEAGIINLKANPWILTTEVGLLEEVLGSI